ncbi:hypothetical protein ACFS5L_02240 [Streptomyces phyllanthi]|uniref:Uncharacterized protein n=1 Tax=Streptomyces phyllanthi TaxID=1803180 RepID=A0A5N8WBI4_9ACTN|nr:hypothetical protein [Streptomyces phyllanthi]MPY44492.1 hypothetical protein [Streptomyces phyllanthi]
MDEQPHIVIGHHDEHGLVALPLNHRNLPLADHHLKNVQFEPIPGSRFYRLTDARRDGRRRARQAVASLRLVGHTVQADLTLDPDLTPATEYPPTAARLPPRRTALAQAAISRSPRQEHQHEGHRTADLPAPTPQHAPPTTPTRGR